MPDAVTAAAIARPWNSTPWGVRKVLVLVAVLTLPFTLALTVNLRFPLKIYEIALIAAGITCIAQSKIPALPATRAATAPLMLLAAYAVTIMLLHTWFPPAGLVSTGFPSRFGPIGDSIAKILYFLLGVLGFCLIAARTYHDQRLVVRVWLAGAIISGLYTWYLLLSSLVGLEPLLLPGIQEPQRFTFGTVGLIRSGTFEEGNFLGLYLVTSVAVAIYAERRVAAAFLSATVLATFSTINLAALAVVWMPLVWIRSRTHSPAHRFLDAAAMLIAVGGASVLLARTGYFRAVVVDKLVGSASISRLERLDQAVTGIRMFLDHPLTGVGISQYGYYYYAYEFLNLGQLAEDFGPKRIPNNVYIELLAELGIIGLALFAVFLARVFRCSGGAALRPLRLGLIAVLLVWNAFPTYSVMFLWAYFGVIVGVSERLAARGGAVQRVGLAA